MRRLICITVLFVLMIGSFFLPITSSVKADYPMPVNYCAYSSGQTVFIKWNYSCPSLYSCEIEIYEYKSGTWDKITTVGAGSSPYKLLSQPYGKHQYRLRAKLTYMILTFYSSYTPTFEAYVLNVPTGLTVSVNPDVLSLPGNPYLTLKWNVVDSNATQVWVWRRSEGFDFPNVIAKLPQSTTTYTDTTVQPNTTYHYCLTALRKDDTLITDDMSLSTALVPKLTLPAAPTNYKANAIDKTVYMSWNHSKNCDGYKVYRWGVSGMILGWHLVGTINKNTLSYSTTVSDYGKHLFKVTAYNASGDSAMSPTKEVYALKKPTGLTATALSSTSIKLTWNTLDSNATTGVISYSTNGLTYFAIGSFTLPKSEATVSGLSPNTQYWFKICVKRDSNESAHSDPASTKTLSAGMPPAPPSNLSAIAVNCGRVEVYWQDNSDNEDGFRIERKEGTGTLAEIGAVTSNMTVLTDTAVSPGKTYTYRVRSFNTFGSSASSNDYTVAVPLCGPVPNAPSNLTATLVTVSEAKLKWNDNSDNEQNFIVEKKAEGGTYAVIETLAANTTEINVTELIPETKYYFRVSAKNEYGYSNYSNEATVTTPSATATPNAPSNLSASAPNCHSVVLNWNDNSINETNFVVERKLEGESYVVVAGDVAAGTTTYTDITVEEGKKYYYKVKAINLNGDSEYSNEASVTVPPCGFPPAAPSNLTATAVSETEIQISFEDNSDNEDGFKVERKEPGGTYELIAVLPAGTTTHKDTGLSPNTIYYYRAIAYNSYGTSAYSNEANAITKKEQTAPTKPTNLVATAMSSTEIKLTWTDTSDNEDGFRIERKTSGSYVEIKTLSAGVTSFTDTGLSPGTTYYYRIRAYNSKGMSEYSNEASATTLKAVQSIIIRLYIDKTTYYVNDEMKTMDVAPIIKESRTLLPIRYVAEALGADVAWDPAERKVTITFKGTTIELWIDKNTARVNGEYKLIDASNPKVAPIIIPPGRTMLPIRFIAENLGCKVDWDPNLREVKITYPAP